MSHTTKSVKRDKLKSKISELTFKAISIMDKIDEPPRGIMEYFDRRNKKKECYDRNRQICNIKKRIEFLTRKLNKLYEVEV